MPQYVASKVSEPEFEQAKKEIYDSLAPLFKQQPELEKAFELLAVPERVIQFRVVWEADDGSCQVNTGYRVQYSSVLGPYKGGLRFHPSVNLSILKFLGFEQIFKNALTGLAMGGGKGGADFDPKGKSDNEIRKFCYAFMRELSKHIGPETDVPAGDIGVGGREVGYLFGAYKQIRNEWSGVLTGKGMNFGGSNIRPEATGYGVIYYLLEMLAVRGESIKGKRIAISGSGNVAQYAALKAIELGGVVVSLSDSKGAMVASGSEGLGAETVHKIAAMKLKGGYLHQLGSVSGFKYVEGSRPWTLVEKIDIALPCATQNEVSGEEAEALLKAGCTYVAEGSNMGSTLEAIDIFEQSRAKGGDKALYFGPPKASNCGGVMVSGLEMAQNSQRIQWTHEEVDSRLQQGMQNCFKLCFDTAKKYAAEGELPSLVVGANIASFLKVSGAAHAQGNFW